MSDINTPKITDRQVADWQAEMQFRANARRFLEERAVLEARVAELEQRVAQNSELAGASIRRLGAERDAARARIADLEAALQAAGAKP